LYQGLSDSGQQTGTGGDDADRDHGADDAMIRGVPERLDQGDGERSQHREDRRPPHSMAP
jgi:hypothetical protein